MEPLVLHTKGSVPDERCSPNHIADGLPWLLWCSDPKLNELANILCKERKNYMFLLTTDV